MLAVVRGLETSITDFAEEVQTVYGQLVDYGAGHPRGPYVQTLYAYMARCFAFIDRLSLLWNPGRSQTPRMADFCVHYMHVTPEAAQVAVKLWRHLLMHTAEVRPVVETTTKIEYHWLLHWGPEQLNRERHFRVFELVGAKRSLEMALTYLVDDVTQAARASLGDARKSRAVRKAFERGEQIVAQDAFFRLAT